MEALACLSPTSLFVTVYLDIPEQDARLHVRMKPPFAFCIMIFKYILIWTFSSLNKDESVSWCLFRCNHEIMDEFMTLSTVHHVHTKYRYGAIISFFRDIGVFYWICFVPHFSFPCQSILCLLKQIDDISIAKVKLKWINFSFTLLIVTDGLLQSSFHVLN